MCCAALGTLCRPDYVEAQFHEESKKHKTRGGRLNVSWHLSFVTKLPIHRVTVATGKDIEEGYQKIEDDEGDVQAQVSRSRRGLEQEASSSALFSYATTKDA